MALSSPSSSPSVSGQCHFTFQGLESAVQGCGLQDLTVRAQFFVDPEVKVEKTANSLEVDASGHARAIMPYPSVQQLCPEIYKMKSVKVIEVRPLSCVKCFFVWNNDEKMITNCCAGKKCLKCYDAAAWFVLSLAVCTFLQRMHAHPFLDVCLIDRYVRDRTYLQVDMVVEVRSRDGSVGFTGPTLKVKLA